MLILVCVFVLNAFTYTLVYSAQTNPGIERLQVGIENYENGRYDDAIFYLEMALNQISVEDKEDLWDAHFYLGLSYYLLGDEEEADKEFIRANEIFDKKLPDPDVHSAKILKLFKETLELTKSKIKATYANPLVLFETSKGDIMIELFEKDAPITVKNFLSYVSEGFYDNLIFHRVIKKFMIQGGGYDSRMNLKKPKALIKNEATNRLSNKRGTIAIARTNVIDSATSQFFINVVNNNFLDHKSKTSRGYGYAVFGKVVEGMDVVDDIARVKTGTYKGFSDVPKEPIIIMTVKLME